MPTFTWASGSSGDWNTAGNWTPRQVPNSPFASAEISPAGTYTVTIAAGQSDMVVGIDMPHASSTLAVNGTLDFTMSAGAITGSVQSELTMNGGTIINGGRSIRWSM